jgi:inosine-uridine nucleoside N-ribohydrolase
MCTCCGHKIPVVLDTDIGYDIDDTWALGFLLKSPEVDLKLVVSDTHDTTYSAQLLAKFLTAPISPSVSGSSRTT